MSTLEIKKELLDMINQGDEKLVKTFFEMVKAYKAQLQKDEMIFEGEQDIKNDQLYSIEEAKEIVNKWIIE